VTDLRVDNRRSGPGGGGGGGGQDHEVGYLWLHEPRANRRRTGWIFGGKVMDGASLGKQNYDGTGRYDRAATTDGDDQIRLGVTGHNGALLHRGHRRACLYSVEHAGQPITQCGTHPVQQVRAVGHRLTAYYKCPARSRPAGFISEARHDIVPGVDADRIGNVAKRPETRHSLPPAAKPQTRRVGPAPMLPLVVVFGNKIQVGSGRQGWFQSTCARIGSPMSERKCQ